MPPCALHFKIYNQLSRLEPGFRDYLTVLEALRDHTTNCPECLAWIHSFPAEAPEHPDLHENEEKHDSRVSAYVP